MANIRKQSGEHGRTFAVLTGILLSIACSAGTPLSAEPGIARREDVLFSGYIRENPIQWQTPPLFSSTADSPGHPENRFTNLLHMRQNLRWYVASPVTAGLELKERLFSGQGAGDLARGINAFTLRLPRFDWTGTLVDRDEAYCEAGIDRFWIELTHRGLELTVGRQRIAWGTNLLYNPIDIFNPSSPLDFDNEEKPGTDAVRVTLYPGPNSVVEAAWAPGREAALTSAALRLKINRMGYDWVFIGGRRASDHVAGFAWAGSIADGGFRGEFLYADPRSGEESEAPRHLSAAISGDYTFRNSLYIQTSVLYNSRGTTGDAGGLVQIESYQHGDLSPARFSLSGEIAGDLTPLWRADFLMIINPGDGSGYYGPSLSWSAMTDLDLVFQALLTSGGAGTEFGDQGSVWMLKGKYSF